MSNFSLYTVVHTLAAAFYCRPDTVANIGHFIPLLTVDLASKPVNECVCCLRCLATLVKSIDRNVIDSYVDQIVAVIMPMVESKHELIAKLAVKTLGRCALAKVKPRMFNWRYNCGKRVTDFGDSPKEIKYDPSHPIDDEAGFVELPDYFEQLIQLLLEKNNHSSTIVRYSVAKYLASICSRLPDSFSEEILNFVLQSCVATQDDLAWHGACLTLAEFVRRGFVHTTMMARVVEVASEALFYEHIKGQSHCNPSSKVDFISLGSFALGSHVRDAAAYICWSMARAYDRQLIGTFVRQLAPLLVCVTCFDTHLNCRRAASAVIQELAGRTQQFPHWIDVITMTEFHELSQVEHTFTKVGVHFSQYEDFQSSIIDHLVDKCGHWDANIRRLASLTLGLISKSVTFANTPHLERILEGTNSDDCNTRHGTILALAHLILHDNSLLQSEPVRKRISTLVSQCKPQLSLFGGDLTREACLVLVDHCCRRSQVAIDQSWSDFVLDCAESNESVDVLQKCTVNAASSLQARIGNQTLLRAMLRVVVSGLHHFAISTVAQVVQNTDLNCFENLPQIVEEILNTFGTFLHKWIRNELRRSETIADSIRVMMKVTSDHREVIGESQVDRVHDLVLLCLDDHLITNKGDVGLVVRMASIELVQPYGRHTAHVLPLVQLVCAEAALHRNKSFRLAMSQLAPLVAQLDDCKIQLDCDENGEDLDLYRQCVALLSFEPLRYHLISGFIFVLADPMMSDHSKTILDFIRTNHNIRQAILNTFVDYFDEKCKCSRSSIPCLISVHTLLRTIPTDHSFQSRVCEITWKCCAKSANPRKYLLACDIYCILLAFEQMPLVLPYLYVLLAHRLPRVRTYTSSELYTALLSLDSLPEEISSQVGSLLQLTDWFSLCEAKKARDSIRDLLKSKA